MASRKITKNDFRTWLESYTNRKSKVGTRYGASPIARYMAQHEIRTSAEMPRWATRFESELNTNNLGHSVSAGAALSTLNSLS